MLSRSNGLGVVTIPAVAGPPFLKSQDDETPGDAGYFLSANRGKRSITVDIAKPEGQEIIRRIAASADVAIENFKAGTLQRYGLDATSLRAMNPRLIYCSVTGFGQDGPRRDQAAYDFAIQAMGGLMSVTGECDDQARRRPAEGWLADRRYHDGDVCRSRGIGGVGASRRDRTRRNDRPCHAGCAGGFFWLIRA